MTSEKLGIPIDNVQVVFGDTDKVQFGLGDLWIPIPAVGGSALGKAAVKVILKGKKIAAHMLEASGERYRVQSGCLWRCGHRQPKDLPGDCIVPLTSPSTTRWRLLEPGLEEQAFYDPVNFTFPSGAHVAEVEIDPETGVVALVNYVAVDDVGTVINPMIVQGQIHGGLGAGYRSSTLRSLRR